MSAAPKPATRRINRGNGHSYLLDGTKCDGVTTLINEGMPKPALVGWAAKAVAEAVCQRRDILTGMSDAEVIDFLRGAPYRDRDAAANKGTAVHYLAAELARGAKIEVPTALQGHVDAYLDWMNRWQPEVDLVETAIVNRRHRYMGTLDMVTYLPSIGTVLLDVKTSRSGVFGETALQLVAYGRAESYIGEDQAEYPMPQIDAHMVLWLTGDAWELYPIEVTERTWRTFLYMAEVARWRDQCMKTAVGAPMARPPLEELA